MTDPITRLNAALEGRYKIEREIGKGGMATVYLAHDQRHNRNVALKVLKPELAAVVGAERFLAEIETTANLQHPHILPLFDSGEADGFLFFVMPYVEGDTLRDKIDREKQLSVEEALKITEDVASALDYAHQQGVVHRDIKPGNILLSSTGEPTVADFGIALAVAQAGGGRVTETGLSVGTPHYMSPEQATGDRDVDPRTDVYALGCVLYEMLVGEPPYSGTTAQAVLAKILTGDAPAPTDLRVSIPPNLDAATRKALEKLPADRFGSAQEFAKALGDPGFRHGEEADVGAAVGQRQWTPLAMGLAALALVLAVLLLLPEPPEPPQPVFRQVLSTEGFPGEDPLQGFGLGVLGQLGALAPDGSSMILPVGTVGEGLQLGLKMSGSTEVTPIPGIVGGRNPVYSPDGQWIAYIVEAELFKRPLVGGLEVRLAEDAQSPAVAWLDDGTILYAQAASDSLLIVQIPEDGGEGVVVFSGPDPIWVHGLPDARGALVVTDDSRLHVLDLRDMSSQMILEEVTRAWFVPTGHLVYARSDGNSQATNYGTVFGVPFDLGALQITGGATPLFDRVGVYPNSADVHLAADGTVLYQEPVSEANIQENQLAPVWVERDGSEELLNLPLAGAISDPAISPDGRRIAFAYSPTGIREDDIWVHDLDQGTFSRVTFGGGSFRNIDPFWTPDGSEVSFSSDRAGSFDLYSRPADLSTEARLLVSVLDQDGGYEGGWSPDGRWLLYRRGSNAGQDLYYAAPDPDSTPVAIVDTPAMEVSPSLSSDGRWLAYRSNESGQTEVYIRPFPGPGGRLQVSIDGGRDPVWAHSGTELFYLDTSDSTPYLTVATVRTEPSLAVESREQLFSFGSYALGNIDLWWDISPDDQSILALKDPDEVGGAVRAGAPDSGRLILVQNFFEELRQIAP